MALHRGCRLGPYEILGLIGAGGMGEVYKARDTRLDRTVAIKILPAEVSDDPDRRARFEREARTIAGLNHSHICTLHDIGDCEGSMFLIMEHVAGQSLSQCLQAGPLPVGRALAVATELADALAAAHRQGIIHRDLKPANIMIATDGGVKVLDFGLAKHVDAALELQPDSATISGAGDAVRLTQRGVVLGTVSYLAPEVIQGRPPDARADIFSVGAVLYELLTGRLAFEGESPFATISAILRDQPPRVGQLRGDVPPRLEAIVGRCLEKDPDARYASAIELHEDLVTCQSRLAGSRVSALASFRNPRVFVAAAVILAAVVAPFAWWLWQSSRVEWARSTAMPEIERLLDEGRSCAAFRLVRQVEKYLPQDPEIRQIRQNFMRPISVRTDPPGADVYVRDYLDASGAESWDYLGRTPLEGILIPSGHVRHRIVKAGRVPVEGYTASALTAATTVLNVKLDTEKNALPEMIRVPAQSAVGEFWLDKYEVTNRQFKEFVARGGYRNVEYWTEPLVTGGRTIGREEALARFKDATGQPGPATWEFGTFPAGQDNYPVGGVSWYEAAAYCAHEKKALPTVHHWRSAAVLGPFTTILQTSNFGGRGPARVGSYGGLGAFGTYDAAGNVREWCFNASGDKRYSLGGAWNDPTYLFYLPDARLPFDRSAGNGFRCARYVRAPARELLDPIAPPSSAPVGAPASDAVFEVYKAFHAYERGELSSRLEATDDSSPYFRQQKVSFRAAYGNEKVAAWVFLPRNASPPFQTVVTFPGTYAFDLRSSARLETQWFDYIVRSGRAVIHPIYKGSYERTVGLPFATISSQPALLRELALAWHKDLARTLDYIETRPECDRAKLAYQGISLGAAQGPRFMALEPRLKAGVLLWGGIGTGPPEINAFNFASRSRAPTLMVNGRSDPIFLFESSQVPMFRLLGASAADKRHIVLDHAGHVAFNQYVVREVLAWLDRYLGPVSTR